MLFEEVVKTLVHKARFSHSCSPPGLATGPGGHGGGHGGVSAGGRASTNEGVDSNTATLNELQRLVWVNARRYNERKVLAEKRQKELFQRLDVLHTLELENASLVSFERNETPDAMKISELQEKIQAINKEMENRVYYRMTLERMKTRLHSNKVKLAKRLGGMKLAVGAGKREMDDVERLMETLKNGSECRLSAILSWIYGTNAHYPPTPQSINQSINQSIKQTNKQTQRTACGHSLSVWRNRSTLRERIDATRYTRSAPRLWVSVM